MYRIKKNELLGTLSLRMGFKSLPELNSSITCTRVACKFQKKYKPWKSAFGVIIENVTEMISKSEKETFQMFPIGYIRRNEKGISLEILEPFRAALKQLDHFSHVMVFWWAHKHDNKKSRSALHCEPPYAKGKITGVFATRAEYRPNPIAMTTCKILKLDENKGIITVAEIDAYDETPIVDLKAYFPVCDRVKKAEIPEWLSDWPEWMPEEGIGL